jgi:hypothetical protein
VTESAKYASKIDQAQRLGWIDAWVLEATPLHPSLKSLSYIRAICWLVLGTLQWWFAGAYLQKRFA